VFNKITFTSNPDYQVELIAWLERWRTCLRVAFPRGGAPENYSPLG
jgi:hypothetical protein